MGSLFVLLLVSGVTSIYGSISVDTVNRKSPRAYCFRDTDAQTLELNFHVDFGGNQVDKVMALTGDTFIRSSNGLTNEDLSCGMNDISLGYVKIASRIDLSGSNHVNKCGARKIGNTNDYKWVIEVRALYASNIYVGIDRRYSVTCLYDSAVGKYAVADLRVFGDDLRGSSTPISPVNSMYVLRQIGQNDPYLVTDTVHIDQLVKLQVTSRVPSGRSPTNIYGLYPFSCSYGPIIEASRTIFILQNGCPNVPNEFGLTNGFKYKELSQTDQFQMRTFKTETDAFVMVRDIPNYPENDFYYISCYVDYCFGDLGTDRKCTDFCDSNRPGRKRRASDSIGEMDQITMVVRIGERTDERVDNVADIGGQSGKKSSQLTVIIATSVATIAFFIILLLVIVVVCYRQGCCNQDERFFDSSSISSGSSRSKPGPMAFVLPNSLPPKA